MSRAGATPQYDVRKESRRRVIIGLTGLMLMLMLVVLVGIVTGQARKEAELAKAQAQAAGVVNPGGNAPAARTNEPLADLGVAPAVDAPSVAAPVNRAGRAAGNGAANGGAMVPDLQPDPQLDAAKAQR
ncbi:MAG: hypothetical protein ACKOUM_10180 [Sphingopyxis sp.]